MAGAHGHNPVARQAAPHPQGRQRGHQVGGRRRGERVGSQVVTLGVADGGRWRPHHPAGPVCELAPAGIWRCRVCVGSGSAAARRAPGRKTGRRSWRGCRLGDACPRRDQPSTPWPGSRPRLGHGLLRFLPRLPPSAGGAGQLQGRHVLGLQVLCAHPVGILVAGITGAGPARAADAQAGAQPAAEAERERGLRCPAGRGQDDDHDNPGPGLHARICEWVAPLGPRAARAGYGGSTPETGEHHVRLQRRDAGLQS